MPWHFKKDWVWCIHRCVPVCQGHHGTLAPFSDIDLLFILPYKQTPWGEQVTANVGFGLLGFALVVPAVALAIALWLTFGCILWTLELTAACRALRPDDPVSIEFEQLPDGSFEGKAYDVVKATFES